MILEDAYIRFLIKHNLTQGQYLLLHLIYTNRIDLVREYKEAFPAGDGTMIGAYFTEDLINRGFIIKQANGKITVTEKFLEIFINKHTACEEIFDLYPTHFISNGVPIPLSAMDRNVFANLYDIAISSCISEHIEIVKDIKWAIQNNMLNLGIDKFLKSKYWKVLRPLRLAHILKEEVPNTFDNTF